VKDIETYYDYVDTFVDMLTRNTTDREMAREYRSKVMLPLDASNRLFGIVKLRQIRVQPAGACKQSGECNWSPSATKNSCANSYIFSKFHTTCYQNYGEGQTGVGVAVEATVGRRC
jgi:hypothetical protein